MQLDQLQSDPFQDEADTTSHLQKPVQQIQHPNPQITTTTTTTIKPTIQPDVQPLTTTAIHHSPPSQRFNHQQHYNQRPSPTTTQKNKTNHYVKYSSLLDREERELINQASNLSKEEIWQRLEQKRFTQLKKAAVQLQSEMIIKQRCPKCTLEPPCKHYQSTEQIINEGSIEILKQENFKQYLPPKKREIILKTLKEQQLLLQQNQLTSVSNQTLLDDSTSAKPFPLVGLQLTSNNNYKNNNLYQVIPETDTFLTNLDIKQDTTSKPINRGGNHLMFNNTMGAGGLRAQSESKKQQQSFLSNQGAKIMSQQQQISAQSALNKRQFLRRRQGNGGSPVFESTMGDSQMMKMAFNESQMSSGSGEGVGPLISPNINNSTHRDRTTIRIRTKNNQYLYSESSFNHPPPITTKNQSKHQLSFIQEGMSTPSQSVLYDRERLQAMIAKYKEDKIQKQIEKIEQERLNLETERQLQRQQEEKRKRYIETQKLKLMDYQQQKFALDQEKEELDKLEKQRQAERERIRREYFDAQRQQIGEYKVQKQKTDELLMIPSLTNGNGGQQQQIMQRNVMYGQQLNQAYHMASGKENQPKQQATGIVTHAGQQFLSGGGQIANPNQLQAEEFPLKEEDINQDDLLDYEQYYDEVDENQQQIGNKTQKRFAENYTSTGIIGENKSQQEEMTNQVKSGGSAFGQKKDSLDLIDQEL